jgi:hypothetical protein
MMTTQARPEYYVPGGALKSTAPSYVERTADKLLLDNVRNGEFCYVLTPRQMGKTSLMVRTAASLRASGTHPVILDLTSLGSKLTPEQWYLGQLKQIAKDLKLKTDYLAWWQGQSHLGNVQRFVMFLEDVVLNEVSEPVVIFVDEIDTTLNLSFSDDYFAAIRSLFIKRATSDRLDRLTFVLLGVASPSDLIQDARRTPFNIGVRIPLTDFTESEAAALLPGLAPDMGAATQLLKQVLFWTGGHPYLTQKTCKEVANWASSTSWNPTLVPLIVDDVVKRLYFSEQGRNQDFNLQFVRDRILESNDAVDLLRLYRRIRAGETVTDDELDPVRAALKLSGLVVASDSRLLRVRNRIYDRVFDDVWILTELRKRSASEEAPGILGKLGSLFRGKPSFKYDVFISYSMRDSAWVRGYLVPRLKSAGIKVFYDAEIMPGSEWRKALDESFSESRSIILVMSPDYFTSDATALEVERALRLTEDAQTERRVIPLLLKSADIPPSLLRLQYIDFRNERDSAALGLLLRALGAENPAVAHEEGESSASPGRAYDTGVIRRLLDEAMDQDDLLAFIYDYFRPIRDAIPANASKKGQIQSLIENCESRGELDRLLDLLARNYPQQYRRYAGLIQRLPS